MVMNTLYGTLVGLCLVLASYLPVQDVLALNAVPWNHRIENADRTVSGVELRYDGTNYSLLYRFLPQTGTFNDLKVTYNETFTFLPSNFGGITSFVLAGETLHPWEQKHTSQLVEESNTGGIYSAKFRWAYKGDSFDFTIRLYLLGKRLVVEFGSTSEKVSEFVLDRSEQTPNPKVIEMPYGHNVLFSNGVFVSSIMDIYQSSASMVIPQYGLYSSTSAYYAYGGSYYQLTNGRRNNLREKVYITISPEIHDTFFSYSNPVSTYRNVLKDKVIVDLWRNFYEYRVELQTLADAGVTDAWIILHSWQKYGYDNGLPSTYPAGSEFGGEAVLQDVISLCIANQYLCAFHTNYVDFYPNSDVWNSADVGLDSNGNWTKAWYNSYTGMQSYLLKPSRALYYAGIYEPSIHSAYRTNSAYLDVHTTSPGSVDYDARVANAGRQNVTFDYYKSLVSYVRGTHQGPVAGEGWGFSTYFWAGYIDAIEADPRAISTAEKDGGTAVPLLVDYKLFNLHHLFVPHGVGYLERFYLGKQNGYTLEELERYRASEIAFGNAGFLSNPFARGIPFGEIKREYCFLKHLQNRYLSETPSQVSYKIGARFVTLSEALKAALPGTTFSRMNETLGEELGILKIQYSNDLVVYVNRTKTKTFELTDGVDSYTLEPNGFWAKQGDQFLAYSAKVNGIKKDFICPADRACGTCPTSNLYLPLLVAK